MHSMDAGAAVQATALAKACYASSKKSSLRVGSGLGGFGTSVPMAPGSSISRLVVIVVGGVFLLGARTAGRGAADEEEEELSAMLSSSEAVTMLFMLWISLSRRDRKSVE